jgi:hypothetical protein
MLSAASSQSLEFFVKGGSITEIVRDLKVSRNTVRKVLRSGETSFAYEREVQPLPRLGRWPDDLDWRLSTSEAEPRASAWPYDYRRCPGSAAVGFPPCWMGRLRTRGKLFTWSLLKMPIFRSCWAVSLMSAAMARAAAAGLRA